MYLACRYLFFTAQCSCIKGTCYDNICLKSPRGEGLITEIHNLVNNNKEEKLACMCKWEFFPFLLRNVKILLITYENAPDPRCTRCFGECLSLGSFSHLFWDCEKISQLWKHLDNFTSSISDTQTPYTI